MKVAERPLYSAQTASTSLPKDSGFLNISPRRVTVWLMVIAVVLTLLSLSFQLNYDSCNTFTLCARIARLVDLNGEANLPVWFSSTCWLLAAATSLFISSLRDPKTKQWRRHWQGLAMLFAFLSFDETAMFHESFGGYFGAFFGAGDIFYYSWILFGLLLLAAIGVVYLRFLLSLPGATRMLLLFAGAIFATGAVGIEMVGGAAEAGDLGFIFGRRWAYLIAMEELFEMVGVTLTIYALLSYAQRFETSFIVKISNRL